MGLIRSSLAADLDTEARRIVATAARIVEGSAPSNPKTPIGKTSHPGPRIRDSFEIGRDGPRKNGTRWTVRARNTAPHAAFVDKGTPPHLIVPRSARVLAFDVNGELVFARRVNHPGTKATGWFDKVMTDEWNRALRAVVGRGGGAIAR